MLFMRSIRKSKLFSRLHKDDIFLSYGRTDGLTYTDGLATELQKRDLSCYYDAYGTDAGEDPQPSLFENLNNCAMLVIVGSKYACASGPVKSEIERFTNDKGTTSVIVIDFDGATYNAIWKKSITGLRREKENIEALTTGNPSASIVNRIEKAFTYRKSKQRLQLYSRVAGIILGILIIAIITAAFILNRQVKKVATATELAARQQKIASALQYANESQVMLDDPDLIVNSVEKAIQSMYIGISVKEHLLAADIALRTSMNFLPVFVNSRPHEVSFKTFDKISNWDPSSVSYGGRYIASNGLLYDTILKTIKDIETKGNGSIKSVLDPNGKYIALIDYYEDSDNNSVEVIDIERNKTIYFEEYPMKAYDIAFSADGGVLAVAGIGEDQAHPIGIAYIWDLNRNGRDVLSESHFNNPVEFSSPDPIHAIAPGVDITCFATAQNSNVTVWKEKSHGSFKPICYIPCSSTIFKLSFDANGNNLTIYKNEAETGNEEKITEETWHAFAYYGNEKIALPSETILFGYDQHNKIMRLSGDIGYEELIDSTAKVYYDFSGKGTVVYYSDDLKYIVTADQDSIYVWNYSDFKGAVPLASLKEQIRNAAITADGKWLAITDGNKKVFIWQWENNRYVKKVNFPLANHLSNIKLRANGTGLIGLDEHNNVMTWDLNKKLKSDSILFANLNSGKLPEISPLANYATFIKLTNGDEKQGTLEIWNLETKSKTASLNAIKDVDGFYSDKKYTWSTDEKYFLIKLNSFTLRLLTPDNITNVRDLNFDSPVKTFSFSPSGKYIGVVTDAGTVKIFEADSAKEVSRLTLNISSDGDAHIVFSANDRHVSIANNEATMSGIRPSLSYFSLSPSDLLNEARNRLQKMDHK